MRYPRITGSKCGHILTQKSKTKALLIDVLYSKPLDPIPLPIKWGRDKEPLAQSKYVDFLRSRGHHNLTVRKCGFYVHPHKGWLGASPDGVVYMIPVYLIHKEYWKSNVLILQGTAWLKRPVKILLFTTS